MKYIALALLMATCTASAGDYEVTIDRVIDGDTVDVNIYLGFDVWLIKKRVRLLGLDTPESRTRDLVEKQYGQLAKHELTKQLEMPVTLHTEGTGKFGRILGDFIFEDGTSLVQHMIDNCYGVAYHGQNKKDVEAEHLLNRACIDTQ